MKFTVITLFPEAVSDFAGSGLLGQAREKGAVSIETLNPRAFTEDVHQTVDDRAFGGGDGMVMKVEPLAKAVASLGEDARVIVLSPQGRPWSQAEAEKWAREGGHRVLVCGRYAGIDQRFRVLHADDEISLGDFVLNGGEVAALAVIESVARLLPGVLGNEKSAVHDTFSNGGKLECPQFTRPREVGGLPVPEPLLSGHHAKIKEFEKAVSEVRTMLLRPDLMPEDFALEKSLKLVAGLSDPELMALGLTRADLAQLEER
jgi:tRNA (guanine37-N1)-methyltransferase